MQSNKLEKIKNLEKTYISTFSDYKSGLMISKEIYGEYNHTFLEQIYKYSEYFEKREKQKSDKNKKWRSSVKPLIEIINNKTKLNSNQNNQLFQIFNSKEFRSLIQYQQGFNNINDIINLISNIAIIQLTSKTIYNLSKNKKTSLNKKDFENKLQNQILEYSKNIKFITEENKDNTLLNNSKTIGNKLNKLSNETLTQLSKLNPNSYILIDMITSTILTQKAYDKIQNTKNRQ